MGAILVERELHPDTIYNLQLGWAPQMDLTDSNICVLRRFSLEMIQIYGDIFEKVVLQQPLPFFH